MPSNNRLTSFSIKAHAKINTHLDIGPKKKNGFHDLSTVFQEISLHDTLLCRPISQGFRLTANSKMVPLDGSNLILKALTRLKRVCGARSGLEIHLDKTIPIGAGLGGGSSNAAAALFAGWRVWRRNVVARKRPIPKQLFKLASNLGADVAFFLQGGRAWGKGKGDKLSPLKPLEKKWLVLIYPRVHVSTKSAYQWLDQFRKNNSSSEFGHIAPINSFESVIFPRFPKILTAYQCLKDQGCELVQMSGSGSAVFGFVRSEEIGQKIVRKISKKPWDVFLTHTL